MRKTIYIVLCLFLMACQSERPEIKVALHSCAVMPVPRASAAACSLNGKGYIFGGRTQDGTYLNDLWQYDPATDSWTQIDTLPGSPRVKPLMIADDEALYIGLGFSKGKVYDKAPSPYLKDLWRYTPSNGKWQALKPCPNTKTISPVPYMEGNKIYLLYSTGWSYSDEIKYYDLEKNRWDSIMEDGHRAAARFAAAGGQCGGRSFFGTGLNKYNLREWHEVDLGSNTWIERTSIPGKGRNLCAYSATDSYIYLFGGRHFAGEYTGGEVFDEYMRYNVADDQWERCGAMPCGRGENMIAFTIDNQVYFGLGEDEQGRMITDVYCIEN